LKTKKPNKSKQVRGSITGHDYITHEHELIARLAATIYAASTGGLVNLDRDMETDLVQHAVKTAHAILREAMTVDAEVSAVTANAAKETRP
jgi:hypothetical protein